MKLKTVCFVAIPLSLSLIACTESLDEGSLNDAGKGAISITAAIDGYTPLAETRTQVGGIIGEDGPLFIEWSVGDTIGVFGNTEAANAPFSGNNTAPAASTTFSGTLTGGDLPQYAYYPYSETVTDLASIPVSIPSEQMYTDETSVAQYDIKASADIQPDASGGYRVKFRQMAALVRFEIDLSGVTDLADDELLMDITIHPTNGGAPMTGEFTYDLGNLDAGLKEGAYTMDGITLYFTYPPTAREKAVAYAVVAPGKHAGEEWTCVFTTDRQMGTFTATALCDFEAGKYYNVPLTAQVLANNEPVYEELPEEETANCYIVTAPGDYDFKATVIGNGMKGIIPGAGFHTENPYINPKSAKELWSDKKDFITNVRLENGRVRYTVPENTAFGGNAVIAVYSEPDCQGEVLWCWHIWGTQGEPQAEEYTNQAGAKFMVMDRPLGAQTIRSSQGLTIYQWGRNTPIPSLGDGMYFVDGNRVSIEVAQAYPHIQTDESTTIADAVREPMKMFVNGSEWGEADWLYTPNPNLWGDARNESDMPATLDNPQAGAGWTSQKTIYDPSPAGWRVANIFTYSGFTKKTNGTTNDISEIEEGTYTVNATRLKYVNYVKYTYNGTGEWFFKKNADDTVGARFYFIGQRDGWNGRDEGGKKNSTWWTSTSYVDSEGDATACSLQYQAYDEAKIDTYRRDPGLSNARPVRCVRE